MNVMRRTTYFALLFALGCGGSSGRSVPTASSGGVIAHPPAIAEPKQPPVDQELLDYKAKVKAFIDEVKSGSKLLSLTPSLAQCRQKRVQIQDIYTRIPDPPQSFKKAAEIKQAYVNIDLLMVTAALLLDRLQISWRIDVQDARNIVNKELPDQVTKLNEQVKAIEAAIK